MTDTHTHPYLPEFPDGGREVVERAIAAGVSHIVLPNVDEDSIAPMMALHKLFPENTSVALGLHPTEVKEGWEETVDRMERMLSDGGFAAVGEIGIDLYWDKTFRAEQKLAFARQLRIADRLSLPVIIHCREGLDDILEAISEVKPSVTLIFHSFTGSREDVERIRTVCDPYFGINGVVTFKNARELRDAIPEIGQHRIVLETDAPYLAPVPHRGKRNEPAYVISTCNAVASALSIPPEELERATDANAKAIFNL